MASDGYTTIVRTSQMKTLKTMRPAVIPASPPRMSSIML